MMCLIWGVKICRLKELHTLKGHVESVVKLKGLDIDTIQQHYTLWKNLKEQKFDENGIKTS